MKANRKAGSVAAPAAGAYHAEEGRRPSSSRGGGRRADEEGAIHVLEAVIFAILLLASIAFVVTFEVPTTQNQQEAADLEVLLADVFAVLASRASPEAPDVYRDALEQYVMEAISGNSQNLTNYLDAVLPPGVEYNMYLDNGFARFPVYVSGSPPRDAVAESRLFVPKLSYTFLEPDVRYQHSEVPMSVWALPVTKGVLLQDEGESIEFWATGTEIDPATGKTIPFTVRSYHTTAWISNAGNARYPSVSIQLNETPGDPTFRYVPVNKLVSLGQSFRYMFPVELRETAGQQVPAGTKLTFHLPRGWNISEEQQLAMVQANGEWWSEIDVEGTYFVGWNVTAELAKPFNNTSIFFRHEADYQFLLDTAANFYLHHEYYLGSGAQGRAEVVVENPSANPIGKLGRRVWPSIARPVIGGQEAVWGLAFTNAAGDVTVTQAGLRVVSGSDMFLDVQRGHRDLTRSGVGTEPTRVATPEWVRADGHTLVWDPPVDVTVATGEGLDFVVPLRFLPSTNKDFRGLDYVQVPLEFDVMWNVTAHNPPPIWDENIFHHAEGMERHGGEFIFKDFVFPYDDNEVYGYPSEEGVSFFFHALTPWQGTTLPGNATYAISADAFLASTFSDYQGAAQQGRINVTDARGGAQREFELGERAYIRNDFSALFAKLGRTEQARPGTISDTINVETAVYTPAGGYAHKPSQVYRETGAVSSSLEGPVARVAAIDLDGDTLLDAVVGGSDRNVYALDGNDGSRFWTYTTGGGHQAGFALADLDGDTVSELITGSQDNVVSVLRKDPAVNANRRVMWAVAPTSPLVPSAGQDVNDVAAFDADGDRVAEVLAATGENTKPGHVFVLDGGTGAEQWNFRLLYDAVSGVDVTFTEVDGGYVEGKPVVFAGSRNDRVYALDAATGTPLYDHAMPPQNSGPAAGDVVALAVADLNGDGTDDTIVAQPAAGASGAGRVLAFNGTKATTDTHVLVWVGAPAIADIEIVDEWRQYWVGGVRTVLTTGDGWVTTKSVKPDLAQAIPYEAVEFLDRDTGFVVTQAGHLYKTTNGGLTAASWSSFANLSVDIPDPDLLLQMPVTGMAWINESEGWVISELGKAYRYLDDGNPASFDWRVEFPPICLPPPADPVGCNRTMTLEDIDVLPSGDVEFAGTYTEIAPGSGAGGVLFRWSASGSEWVRERLLPDKMLFGVDMLDDSEGWAVGATGTVLHTENGWTTYETQTLNDGTQPILRDVEMTSARYGYASGAGGAMYRLIDGGDQWTRLAGELPVGLLLTTVAALDHNYAWFGGDLGHMAAFHSYRREAPLETVRVPFQGATSNPLTVELVANEALIIDNANYPMGVVDWLVSTDGGAAWTQLELDADPNNAYESGLYKDYLFRGSVPCSGCGDVKVKAVLRTQNSPSTGLENDDFTPLLARLATVDLKTGGGVLVARLEGWDLVKGQSTITQSGTTRYQGDVVDRPKTDALPDALVGTAGAVVMPRMDKFWSFEIGTAGGSALAPPSPYVDASRDWTGDGLPDVLAAGEKQTQGLDLVLLDGRRGTVVARWTASAFGDPGYPTALSVVDVDSDGDPEAIVATENGNVPAYVEVLERSGSTFTRLSQRQGGDDSIEDMILDVTAAGYHDGDNWTEILFGDKGGAVRLVDVNPLTSELWTTNPSELQGKVTFSYPLGMQSLYGTYFVVSSLEFELTEGGKTITQVAKLVDYFHVKPPGGEVPRPPLYDLEIVAWIPEV